MASPGFVGLRPALASFGRLRPDSFGYFARPAITQGCLSLTFSPCLVQRFGFVPLLVASPGFVGLRLALAGFGRLRPASFGCFAPAIAQGNGARQWHYARKRPVMPISFGPWNRETRWASERKKYALACQKFLSKTIHVRGVIIPRFKHTLVYGNKGVTKPVPQGVKTKKSWRNLRGRRGFLADANVLIQRKQFSILVCCNVRLDQTFGTA